MPTIEPEVRERTLRLLETHGGEYSSLTAAAEAVARQVGVGMETVRRWAVQAHIDGGTHCGVTSEESAELKKLKPENPPPREDVAILKAAATFFAGGNSTPKTDDNRIHRRDAMRPEGTAVESICRVLYEQCCRIEARTSPAGSWPGMPRRARTPAWPPSRLRMALGQRAHNGHPAKDGDLIQYSDAGSQEGYVGSAD